MSRSGWWETHLRVGDHIDFEDGSTLRMIGVNNERREAMFVYEPVSDDESIFALDYNEIYERELGGYPVKIQVGMHNRTRTTQLSMQAPRELRFTKHRA